MPFGGIDMFRKRQLYQNSVNGRIVVKTVNELQKILLGGIGGKVIGFGNKTDFLTGLPLVVNIDLGCRILAYENHCQPRSSFALVLKSDNFFC